MKNQEIPASIELQFGELRLTPLTVERLGALDFTVPELMEAIEDHRAGLDGEPAVYVGTYRKYNRGCLRGLWVDLSSFSDYNEFIIFCEAIHADELDPELMAQDYENFPHEWYNEGFISRKDFDSIQEYVEMCMSHDPEAVDDWLDIHGSLSDFSEAYVGKFDDDEEFGRHFVEEECPEMRPEGFLADYIDYEALGSNLLNTDFTMGAHNHVFRCGF